MVSKNVNPMASDGFLAFLRAFFGSGGIARAIEMAWIWIFKRLYRQSGLSAA